MTKKSNPQSDKKSLMSQEFSMNTIREAIRNRKSVAKKAKDGTTVPDNSRTDFEPSTPSVNLLPPHVKELYAAQDLGKKFLGGGGILLAVFGILFVTSVVSSNIYSAKIDEINAATAQLNVEATALQPYSMYHSAVDGKRSTLSSTVADQVDVADINVKFNEAVAKSGYDVSSAALSLSGAAEGAGGSCVNPNPFEPAQGIGCVTFSLSGNGDLSVLYKNLNSPDSGFVNVFVPSTSTAEEGSTIDGSVSVLDSFKLDKYTELSMPMNQVLPATAETEGEQNKPAETVEGAGN